MCSNQNNHINSVKKLIDIIYKLRSKNGCPWDKKQTSKTMTVYLLEEVYELIDAIFENNIENVCEESGDVLFQLLFIIILYSEKSLFKFKDVIETNAEKMIRRHPHVFENLKINNIEKNWDKIKEKEKPHRKSILDSIPKTLPSLMQAHQISKKAAKFDFDWENIEGAIEKCEEEIEEFKTALKQGNEKETTLEFGDILFSLVNVARFAQINPELALRESNKKFKKRFKYMENILSEKKENLKNLTNKEKDILWEQAKTKVL